MFLTAKLNLLSGVAIGDGAVLLMKQCCKQKKKHQKTTTHHPSKVENPKDGEASAQVVLVGSNNGVTSFVFRQEHLWLKPINVCYLRSFLGGFLIMISSYGGCYLSISSSQRQQMTQSCDQGSKTSPCAGQWRLRRKFDGPLRYHFSFYFPSIQKL